MKMKNLLIVIVASVFFASCGGHNNETDIPGGHTHGEEHSKPDPNRNLAGEKMIKNIDHRTVLQFADQVGYLPGQVVSKTIAQNSHYSLTLFSFDKDEEISTHDTSGDALVLILDGTGKITIDGSEHILNTGEAIVMPANVPHAVYGVERFKMLLTVLFP
jgi:quercetin dioxygenase-like cupin family protein